MHRNTLDRSIFARGPSLCLVAGMLAFAAACSGSGGGSGANGNSPSTCPPDQAFFVEHIWTPIVSNSCLACHNQTGAAKDSRLVLAMPSEPGFLEKNFALMTEIAAEVSGGTSILLSRPTGRHPEGHPGGVLFDPGSDKYEAMATFVGRVLGDEAACQSAVASCEAGAPGPRQLRRLSRSEYDLTIRDLLGINSTYGAGFTADTVVNGFDNNAKALTVTPLLADQVRKAAEELASAAVANLGALLPCDASGGRSCAETFVQTFGERAFRRPLSATEVSRYLVIYDIGAEESFEAGVELVIAAILQSPNFLYRSELGDHVGGGVYELTPHEIASELSYFLWGTMPDDALFAAARSGALRDPAEIEAQTRRMLASPKSRGVLARFAEQWLDIEQLPVVPKDASVFPELTADIRAAMAEEAARFFIDVAIEGQGSVADLLLADHTFVNAALAAHYGIAAPTEVDAAGFGRVDLSDNVRGGLLTLGGLMTMHARPNGTSPIHRGKLVRERLFCQHLPPPPPGINAEPPAIDPSTTTRERYRQHANDQACAGCHNLMDPIGFAFEQFDGIGRYRDSENGLPIELAGEILGTETSDGTFTGTAGLAEHLAASDEVRDCFTLQWFRFAYGVEENGKLACLLDEVSTRVASGDQSIVDVIVALTQSSHFTRRIGEEVSSEPGPGPEPEPEPDGGTSEEPEPDTSLRVEERTDSQWQTGSCHTVTVFNEGDTDSDWQIVLEVTGTISNFWNANASAMSGSVTFSGVEWNNVIAPGANASFGFCVAF